MAGQRASDNDAAIRDFKTMLQECTMQATCGRHYVLVAKLATWLRTKVHPGTPQIQASRLLLAAYRNRIQPGLPIHVEQFSPGEDCCILVFSILLELGKGEFVHICQRQNIVDRHLPMDSRSLRRKLAKESIPNPEELAIKFDDLQWRFCAAKFNLDIDRDHVKNVIIPICSKEMINAKGGTAQLWQIAVQEEFVGSKLKEAVSSSGFDDPRDNFGYRYQFALKTFREANMSIYTNEMEAYHSLRNHEGMVRYLAGYAHKEIQPSSNSPVIGTTKSQDEITKSTYNILLEFGEFDLDEYFVGRLPPVMEIEIGAFWKDLFEVADAVESIHNLKTNTDGVVQEYYGWHADIKPDNILSVQGKFKLADPGFAKFVKKKNDKIPRERLWGGTETYGAPERDPTRRDTVNAVPQTIDTWSLGCVFSIAATWVALGYQGILQFTKLRQKAIKKIVPERDLQHPSQNTTLSITLADHFHDGHDVLADVLNWHVFLRRALRKTDTMTNRVLDLIDDKMLLGSATERINAKDMCAELKQLLSQTQQSPDLPESIMEALREVDDEAPSTSLISTFSKTIQEKDQSLIISSDRKARKSKLLDLPLMKTTHRSENFKSVRAPSYFELESSELPHIRPPIESLLQIQPQSCESQSGTAIQTENDSYGRLSSPPITSRSGRPTGSRRDSQNVFQAREAIENREKHNLLKRTRKDALLTRYFGSRDIKFLVDNGETMIGFWYEATYLLETLVKKAVGQDENGMDLTFTAGPVKVENKNRWSDFKKAMCDARAIPTPDLHTDMRKSLGNIFQKYIEELEGKRRFPQKEVKNLTLIVLTDGIWAGVRNKDEVNQKVVSFAKELGRRIGDLKERPVSIEFIQFGHDEEASYRLRHLDNDLKWQGIPDIIDTEPSTGDVNKMLLGSFVEEYDEEDDKEVVAHPSPFERANTLDTPRQTGSPITSSRASQPFTEQNPTSTHPSVGPLPHPPSRSQTMRNGHSSVPAPSRRIPTAPY